MGFGGDTGTAAGIHDHRGVRERCPENQGVGYHADIRAQSQKLDLQRCSPEFVINQAGKRKRAKGYLFYQSIGLSCQCCLNFRIQPVARGARNAVGDRQLPALQRLQIVFPVGIQRYKNGISVKLPDLFRRGRYNGNSLRRAQRTADKVLLHVHNNEHFFHIVRSSVIFGFWQIPQILRSLYEIPAMPSTVFCRKCGKIGI